LGLSACSQQTAATPTAIPPPLTAKLPPSAAPIPVEGFSLPRPLQQSIPGFEVYGHDQTIAPPLAGAGASETTDGITFNFVNAPVTAVAQTIFGQLLKENYTIDGGVQGNITLQTTRPLSLNEVVPALETSLQIANLALTHEDDGYHIVPLAAAVRANARLRV
jgi:general secretion pathway protein D